MELSSREIPCALGGPHTVTVMLNLIHSPATHDPKLPAGVNARCIKPLYRVKTSRPLIGPDVTTIFRLDSEVETEKARITWKTFRSSVIEFGGKKFDFDKFLVPGKPFSKSRLIHVNGETFEWKRGLELYNSQHQLVAKYHRPSNPNSLIQIKESQFLDVADGLDRQLLDIVVVSFVIMWTRERQEAGAQVDS
ncbi:hypothetical protein BD410DRAFT_788436 [Rickenella mellea]|uniref:DUF6593 domain-containing protein n=1 Tax=Rickenella mellea TaxID=50990 RepID=A0A4Y7Q638_9AGAM|nr:hypothetical protein BD410DRAFT_788436 [Rickenella mellea]